MKTLMLLVFFSVVLSCGGQDWTNVWFVDVINSNALPVSVVDDSGVCTTAFQWGLSIGGGIAGVLCLFWMLKSVPGGGSEEL